MSLALEFAIPLQFPMANRPVNVVSRWYGNNRVYAARSMGGNTVTPVGPPKRQRTRSEIVEAPEEKKKLKAARHATRRASRENHPDLFVPRSCYCGHCASIMDIEEVLPRETWQAICPTCGASGPRQGSFALAISMAVKLMDTADVLDS